MSIFTSKKTQKLLALQNILYPNYSTNKLVFPEDKLYELANQKAQICLDSIQCSTKICNFTDNPKQFFQSFDNLINQAEQLIKLESYVNFIISSPSKSLENIRLSEQVAIGKMLERYCDLYIEDTFSKPITKTKETILQQFYSTLSQYRNRLNNENVIYLNDDCKHKIYQAYKENQAKYKQKSISSKHKKAVGKADEINIDEVKTLLKDFLDISADYTEDGYYLSNINNTVVPKASDELQYQLIDQLLKYASPLKLKLILIDDSLVLSKYHIVPHLYIPIVNDPENAKAVFTWILSESINRFKSINDNRCTDIDSYNQLVLENLQYIKQRELQNSPLTYINVATQYFPHIVVIVNEAHSLIKDKAFQEGFIDVLLKIHNCGIHFFLFSRLTLKSLNLGIVEDLLIKGNQDYINSLFDLDFNSQNQSPPADVDQMSGHEFEQFCGELLLKNGFNHIVVTKSSGDYGADVTAIKDGIKYAIQCKKYSSAVGVSAVQEVIASKSIYNCHVAVVLTNSVFTTNAKELAEKNNVLLWDKDKLHSLNSINEQ